MIAGAQTLLELRGLVTEVASLSGPRRVVDGLDFTLSRGETLCIAGESGSGKSMTALSLMGLLPQPMARIGAGSALFKGRDLFALPPDAMQAIRGRQISMIFQEPMTSLNPILTVGRQLSEAITAHGNLAARDVKARAFQLLDQVQIPEAARRLTQYPHELSGGMRQRVMIAIALSQKPDILIADEPTTALDVTVQAQILSLIRLLQQDTGTAVIMITHEMGVVAEMADTVLVMKDGRQIETGAVGAIFKTPTEPYTRALLAAVPRLGAMTGTTLPKRANAAIASPREVVDVNNLTVRFDLRDGFFRGVKKRVHAVEGISFRLLAGETLAIVGESGCGKSTTARALLNLVPYSGDVRVNGTHIAGLRTDRMKPVRRDIQMIFQDPYASLDPRMRVGELVAEPLKIHGLAKGSALTDRVEYLFRRVGLPPEAASRYPHEFSGGQRQRICIARALSLSPKVIVADESVSALDVSIQAQVLDLLQDIQNETGIAYLFISHDMAVVEQISHRVAVMYMGRFVEVGTRAQIFDNPQHDYTRKLMAAVPVPDPSLGRRSYVPSAGELPSSVRPAGYEPAPITYRDVGAGHLVAEVDG